MIERLGYFENVHFNTMDKDYVNCEATDRLPIYNDSIPKDDCGDCFRLSLIDGTLLIEKWESENKGFYPIVCTNNFRLFF